MNQKPTIASTSKYKVCAGATILLVLTATVSLSAPRELRAAEQALPESDTKELTAVPALAIGAVAGLVGAFVLGAAQGYLECKNSQKTGSRAPASTLANFGITELDYVLD